ncbi:phosphoribosylglycinamide formyltransferase [Gordoniibacillus kamchatkensis]|uniref:Phosphoribosylglycinamide formyltransferase n=1 Tax=Gordoniibacillus kamchatkensis TaxID=1590651 RepID=A0ABR5AMW3_9BACL|nr:phosphoribosylglycinamide formyltransferase [Paenibacillus sp. VKM B-2647]
MAVFASGSGSNFQAIVDAVRAGRLDVSVELLVCDRPKAKAVERAQHAGIDVLAFRPKDYGSREEYERMIVGELQRRGIDLIVLAGYMRIISATLLEPFDGRIVNIHPSLLPSFPGVDAIGQALTHGVKVTGVTVHFVDGGMDTGPIIAQRAIEIREDDTADTLAARIHAIEHELYPLVIGLIKQNRATLLEDGRTVRIQ